MARDEAPLKDSGIQSLRRIGVALSFMASS